jgi:hypothetical protein
MRVVTYASNHDHPGLNQFLRPSCEYHGISLTVLPAKPAAVKGRWSNRKKDILLADFLETVDDDEIIFSTDAYDAWLLAGEEEILRKYRAFKHPLVFSAERNCWPYDPELKARYPESPSSARYLNSGGMIGAAGAIRDALTRIKQMSTKWKYRKSNQYRWSKLSLENPAMITLDTTCQIFYCAAIPGVELRSSPWGSNFKKLLPEPHFQEYITERILDQIQLEGARVCYKQTGNLPCHLHFNGPPTITMGLPVWKPLRPWLGE